MFVISDTLKFINLFLSLITMIIFHAVLVRNHGKDTIMARVVCQDHPLTWKYALPIMVILFHHFIYYVAWTLSKLSILVIYEPRQFFEYWSSLMRFQEILTIFLFSILSIGDLKEKWNTLHRFFSR